MEIAILVFFLAIFSGVLFLLALIWFLFRRFRNRRSSNRNFSSTSNYCNSYVSAGNDENYINSDDASAGISTDNSTFEDQTREGSAAEAAAQDTPHPSENVHSHAGHSEYSAAPAETSYGDSSSSGSDFGSSSDSGSSDSGSSSSSSSD